MNNYSKAKRKKYFSSNLMAKKNRDLFVKFGLKGFLCTCNGYEKQCIRESYNLLNEYADKLFGEEKVSVAIHQPFLSIYLSLIVVTLFQLNKSEEPDESQSSTSFGEDVMDEFQKEVDAMKTQTAKKTRRFQALDTSIINCIFVETTVKIYVLQRKLSSLIQQINSYLMFVGGRSGQFNSQHYGRFIRDEAEKSEISPTHGSY